MKTYYVRRKDLDHVPFQFYIGADGVAQPLEPGYTGVFTIIPPRGDIDTVYVRIVDALMHELEERWDIASNDLMRLAAKGVEAWLKNDGIPADHFYGPEWIKMDTAWFVRDATGAPALANDPYKFEVVTDEPGFSILEWDFNRPREEIPAPVPTPTDTPVIIFGFTLEIFPAMVILGCEQMKRKVADAGLRAQVKMARLDDLPADTRVLIVPPTLVEAAQQAAPQARVVALTEMVNAPAYDVLLDELKREQMREITGLG